MNATITAINSLATEVYQNAVDKGFHDQDTERSDVENYAIWTTNLHGEVSELWEAARKDELNDPCDKQIKTEEIKPQGSFTGTFTLLTCEEEELADIIIRVLDTAHARGIDIGRAVLAKHDYNKTRPHRHGGKLA